MKDIKSLFFHTYFLNKFGTLISEYNFVFSLGVETLVSIMLFVHVQNLGKDICIKWEIKNPINILQPRNGLNL
jgi:hypothetical protein